LIHSDRVYPRSTRFYCSDRGAILPGIFEKNWQLPRVG
jgi:hypothetical protein